VTIQICSYHELSENRADDVHTLTFSEFENQLRLIKQSGIDCPRATPENWIQRLPRGKHHLGITFDDGCKSDLKAAEILLKHGLSAMFFVSTANIGRDGYLNEGDIRQMESMGMYVGSHSHEHIQLTTMPIGEALQQMSRSKDIIEAVLGHPVDALAFPGGSYNSKIVDAALKAGFKFLMTTDWGTTTISDTRKSFVFKRDNILHGMKDEEFLRLITLKSQYQRQIAFFAKQVVRTILPAQTYRKVRSAVAKIAC
jgi:peptidoglycan/xylan/chitin deacetylase (PgdA/CDA1 family)